MNQNLRAAELLNKLARTVLSAFSECKLSGCIKAEIIQIIFLSVICIPTGMPPRASGVII